VYISPSPGGENTPREDRLSIGCRVRVLDRLPREKNFLPGAIFPRDRPRASENPSESLPSNAKTEQICSIILPVPGRSVPAASVSET